MYASADIEPPDHSAFDQLCFFVTCRHVTQATFTPRPNHVAHFIQHLLGECATACGS